MTKEIAFVPPDPMLLGLLAATQRATIEVMAICVDQMIVAETSQAVARAAQADSERRFKFEQQVFYRRIGCC